MRSMVDEHLGGMGLLIGRSELLPGNKGPLVFEAVRELLLDDLVGQMGLIANSGAHDGLVVAGDGSQAVGGHSPDWLRILG